LYNSNFYMESNHPFAKINMTRDPKEIISDTIELKWGYIIVYVEK
jgi:hypothetical protein